MPDVPGDDGDVMAQLKQLSSVRTRMTDARIGDAEWTSVFRIQRRIAAQYRRGRILLAGDAAHIHSPFGGQGLNTGIGDAENLAGSWCLSPKVLQMNNFWTHTKRSDAQSHERLSPGQR